MAAALALQGLLDPLGQPGPLDLLDLLDLLAIQAQRVTQAPQAPQAPLVRLVLRGRPAIQARQEQPDRRDQLAQRVRPEPLAQRGPPEQRALVAQSFRSSTHWPELSPLAALSFRLTTPSLRTPRAMST